MGFKSFNDRLALFLIILIPAIWISSSLDVLGISLPGEVTGALINTWGMVIYFYFRKGPPANGGEPPKK